MSCRVNHGESLIGPQQQMEGVPETDEGRADAVLQHICREGGWSTSAAWSVQRGSEVAGVPKRAHQESEAMTAVRRNTGQAYSGTRIVTQSSWRLVDLNHMERPARLRGSWCFREVSTRAHQERSARWTCHRKRTPWVPGRGGCPQAAKEQTRGSRGQPSVQGRPPVRAMYVSRLARQRRESSSAGGRLPVRLPGGDGAGLNPNSLWGSHSKKDRLLKNQRR